MTSSRNACAAAAACLALALAPGLAPAGVVHTLSVDAIDLPPGDSVYRVDVKLGDQTVYIKVNLNKTHDNTTDKVAAAIANAINNDTADGLNGSSTANGDVVEVKFVDATTFVTKAGLDVSPGTVISSSAGPGQGVGYLNVLPNPDSGQSTLTHDETITAGFYGGSGLAAVSFHESAGASLSQIRTDLNGALTDAGYVTSLTAYGVLVDGDGAGGANLLKLGMTTVGINDDSSGLDLQVAGVPEPSTCLGGLIAAAAGLAYARARTLRARRAA